MSSWQFLVELSFHQKHQTRTEKKANTIKIYFCPNLATSWRRNIQQSQIEATSILRRN
jgi:hypothetical protein